MGGLGPLKYGSLWERLVRGVRWSWVDPRYAAVLPKNLDAAVMAIESRDRLHAKQGRSTARLVFDPGTGKSDRLAGTGRNDEHSARPVAVYLKRHYRLPW